MDRMRNEPDTHNLPNHQVLEARGVIQTFIGVVAC